MPIRTQSDLPAKEMDTPPMPPTRHQGASTYGRRRILTGSCADYLAGRDAAVH